MKKMLISTLAIIGLVVLGGCDSNKDATNTTTVNTSTEATTTINSQEIDEEAEEITVAIKVMKEEEEISDKEMTTTSETSLLDVLSENFEVKVDNGMITAIEGIEQNDAEGFYWTYTINDEMVYTGAEETLLKNGDKVVFSYAKF